MASLARGQWVVLLGLLSGCFLGSTSKECSFDGDCGEPSSCLLHKCRSNVCLEVAGPPIQVDGDCSKVVCNGTKPITVGDDFDLPPLGPGMNAECTVRQCLYSPTGGAPRVTDRNGESCSKGICNGYQCR
ncbi:MAG: hypothetical protein JNL79_08125 [Myxococcales bacterium]|nr:hypothetical protein [Myxococcales bacterium]